MLSDDTLRAPVIRPRPSRLRRGLNRFVRDLPLHVLLLVPAGSVVFLLYYLTSNAVKPTFEFYRSEVAVPRSVSLGALGAALTDGGMLTSLRNSLILTGASVTLALLLGAAAAFALARLHVPSRTLVFVAMLVPMSISPLIVTIPLFAQFAELQLINTFWGGIAIYVGLRLSFTVYVLEGVFRELPDELFEAARIDGASELRVFWQVLLPLAAPGLAAVGLLNMIEVWNDLLVGLLFLPDPSTIPLSANIVGFQQKFGSDPQAVFAGLLIAALPMLLVYAALQRQFVRGLMGGAFR